MQSESRMSRTSIDTNIFRRYITNDVPEKANIFEHLVNKAQQGEILLFTNSIVIAEIVCVLKSFYGYSKKKLMRL
jgi:predicted nucleic acid-binding protein